MSTSYLKTHIVYPEADFPFRIDFRTILPEAIHNLHLHSHSESIEIQYVHCGNGQYFVGGRFFELRPRTLCVIPADSPHAYLKLDTPLALNKTTISCTPSLLRSHVSSAELASWFPAGADPFRQHLFLSERAAARMEQLLALLGQEWNGRPPFYREAIGGFLRQVLIEIGRTRAIQDLKGPADDHDAIMEQLLAIIDASFAKPLSLADLASQVKRSACHVSRLFGAAKGLTFKEYLAARRVVEARRLLETDQDRKIYAIALDSGFATLSSFNRTFSRLVGMAPSSYRALHIPSASSVGVSSARAQG